VAGGAPEDDHEGVDSQFGMTEAGGAPEDDHVEGTLSADGRENNKRKG
jgi:hypothetical protein